MMTVIYSCLPWICAWTWIVHNLFTKTTQCQNVVTGFNNQNNQVRRLFYINVELARMAVRSLRWVSDYRTDGVDSIKLFSSVRQNMISWHFRPLRWVSDYRTDRVDSIKLFSSVHQNMISWHFRPLRWVSDYRTDKVDSINFFLHIVKIACRAWWRKIASLGVGLSYGQGRLHKTFFFSSQNMISWHFRPALHWTPPPKIDLQGCRETPLQSGLVDGSRRQASQSSFQQEKRFYSPVPECLGYNARPTLFIYYNIQKHHKTCK